MIIYHFAAKDTHVEQRARTQLIPMLRATLNGYERMSRVKCYVVNKANNEIACIYVKFYVEMITNRIISMECMKLQQ
jgi:hypothetical protein